MDTVGDIGFVNARKVLMIERCLSLNDHISRNHFFHSQRKREDDPSLVYAQVREVTGAPDSVIEEAIKACIRTDGSYKVEDVVTTIIADDTVLGSNKLKVSSGLLQGREIPELTGYGFGILL